MDIVSRLKVFISYLEIPVTQFADNCQIPRPSLSQLLNGRNTKVSDKLISKIHAAYPDLSVLWLMFGEGDMLHSKNIKTSEPQNQSIFDINSSQSSDNQPAMPSIDFEEYGSENESEKFGSSIQPTATTPTHQIEAELTTSDFTGEEDSIDENASLIGNSISFSTDSRKKIVNIIVYYSDNSFESFIPRQ